MCSLIQVLRNALLRPTAGQTTAGRKHSCWRRATARLKPVSTKLRSASTETIELMMKKKAFQTKAFWHLVPTDPLVRTYTLLYCKHAQKYKMETKWTPQKIPHSHKIGIKTSKHLIIKSKCHCPKVSMFFFSLSFLPWEFQNFKVTLVEVIFYASIQLTFW